jgi:hypothetical protein
MVDPAEFIDQWYPRFSICFKVIELVGVNDIAQTTSNHVRNPSLFRPKPTAGHLAFQRNSYFGLREVSEQ